MLIQATATSIPMKDESCQLCCFSPPYWGLRKYSVLPLVWGGDSGCEHAYSPLSTTQRHNKLWATNSKPENCFDNKQVVDQGQFCQLCGAWRGDLGLEPTPELYLDHMMLVMGEVWRVLRDDGVCFVNIGDAYSSGGRQCHGNRISYKQGTNKGCLPLQNYRPPAPEGVKPKSLCLIPQKFAIRCQEAGWILRSEIIWAKPRSERPLQRELMA